MALQDKKIMPPPWLAHREIERYSIGWRMGYGEDYIDPVSYTHLAHRSYRLLLPGGGLDLRVRETICEI